MPSNLAVFSIIRNGLLNGYPFVEAYGSWLDYCDHMVILEGDSTDGTDLVLAELARLCPKVTVVTRPWPAQNEQGTAIAEFTNAALALAAPDANYLMYVQADEIYTREQRQHALQWRGGGFEFAGYVNFWNSLSRVLTNDFGWSPLRLFPASAGARSIGDGFSFDLGTTPIERAAEPILHYGWCFPVNILHKHLSHAALYREDPQYRLRGWLAGLMLRHERFDQRLLDALAPQYRPQPFTGQHPECMQHLVGLKVYDPYLGLDLLASGVRW